MLNQATQKLRDYAARQVDEIIAEQGPPIDDREQMIDRWLNRLLGRGAVPDDILAAMPEVSRHNDPQVSPQQYECGCVAVTRITDRDCRTWLGYDEKPFEMRLALPCDGGSACELAHLRTKKP
ncbi:MAG TPA: hypothetical protein VLE97_10675 [Gaiellaceae bacterium]|nr:hypothetical protein [Gaiellaceae bacterium]